MLYPEDKGIHERRLSRSSKQRWHLYMCFGWLVIVLQCMQGFIDISQRSRKVVFMGTLAAGSLEIGRARLKSGHALQILREGNKMKFVKQVGEKTFASNSSKGKEVVYITVSASHSTP